MNANEVFIDVIRVRLVKILLAPTGANVTRGILATAEGAEVGRTIIGN